MVSWCISQKHFIHFTNRQANGQWSFRFCPPPRIFFSSIAQVFWTALFESTYGRLLLEQYFSFRGLVIKLKFFCKLLLNWIIIHSSKLFFRDSLHDCIDYYIFIWLVWCNFLYMVSVLCLRGKNQPNKQTNKTFTRLARRSFKTQLKNTFYLIMLKFSEVFGGK